MKSIYAIKNILSGQSYVGSTINTKKRWKAHAHNLNNGTHHSETLQADWKLLGSKYFKFIVLEHIYDTTNSDLTSREQFWIDKLDSYHNGYNSISIASRPFTYSDQERKITQERRNLERYHGIPSEPKYIKKLRKRPLNYNSENQIKWEQKNLEYFSKLNIRIKKLKDQKNFHSKLAWILGISIIAASCLMPVLVLPAIYVAFLIGQIIAGMNDSKIFGLEQDLKALKDTEPKFVAYLAREEEIDLEKNKRKKGSKSRSKRWKIR